MVQVPSDYIITDKKKINISLGHVLPPLFGGNTIWSQRVRHNWVTEQWQKFGSKYKWVLGEAVGLMYSK